MTQEEGDVSCTWNPGNHCTKGGIGEKEDSTKEAEKEDPERWGGS